MRPYRQRTLFGLTIVAAVGIGLSGTALYHQIPTRFAAPRALTAPAPEPARDWLSWLSAQPVGLNLASGRHRAEALSVRADGMAARAGLRPGDTLVRVGNLQEPSPDQAAEHIRNAWAAGKCAIRLVVSRSGQDFYVPLPLRP